MKKKHLRVFRHMVVGLFCLMVPFAFQAQVTNPETWSTFVQSDANPSVIDTFRWQLFTQAERNNWKYILKNGATVSEGQQGLKMPLSSSVAFEEYALSCYDDVHMVVGFTLHSLVADEALFAIFSNRNGEKRKLSMHTVSANEDNAHYSWGVKGNPYYLELLASDPIGTSKNGHLQIDSVYSYGTICQYSLFSGRGNWNDTLRWSHLPPLRYRSALISGDVEVDSVIQCKQVSLSGGSLHIAEKGHLVTDELILYRTDFPLTNTDKALTSADNLLAVTGKLSITRQLSVCYTFPEKGKWYFLSFPFDVSIKGIDKRFQLKDGSFSGKGNYLYVQVYDGDKRARNKKATGNWTVLSPAVSADELVFEKGKGYLVSLDAAASDNTLTFSVSSDNIPADFGKTSTIPVHVSSGIDIDEAHYGWYLCGNPLPSPLSLSQIASDPALDGNIYLYDGTDYKSYPVGSDYVLPPFAAFFVKASSDTEIDLTSGVLWENAIRLKTGYTLSSSGVEPGEAIVHSSRLQEETKDCMIRGKKLYLSGLSVGGLVQVVDFMGRIVYHHSVSPGSSVLSLPLPAGFYIINIVTDSYRAQHKCVLTQ